MGLFDDDFYSTKVSKRTTNKPIQVKRVRRSSWQPARRRVSALQVGLISGIVSAVVAVLLFSLLTGMPSSAPLAGASINPLRQTTGDPYERIVQAAAKVRPAVVSIVNYKDDGDGKPENDDSALGSGVIFRKEGGKAYIMTNNHVIDGADDLEVMDVNGENRKAKLVGKDRVTDIAVLSIDDKGIDTIAEIGDSSKLRLGETVIAIGNPLGLGDTLTSGIVSYTNRIIPVSINQDGVYDWEQQVIQTDAAINEGNSGGALVDLDGKVIGINTMKIADTGVEGLGFAIPANQVLKTADDLVKNGKISRPYIGVYTVDLNNPYAPIDEDQRKELKLPDEVKDGAIVLESQGPAKDAGLKLNDVIVAFNGEPIGTTLDLRKYLYDKAQIGEELEVTIYRDGKKETVKVKLGDKPEEK
ncbi:trypsin-like peptidase domain-containing protein [Paenibacillus sp. JX-17]|uniref:Trypsin-like peptidase domain-containing protein n=1 Tax=Paenibacillus lacisoli TaxID=3064525 RepID=A0ABT9CAC2_9BACL|nr:trypsin-like peptidase domain-containing protein [Paenibacillus sp. JX-17]MDO7906199.1 trypsin-like peptidase domain-containing protein [Paenibacillus sp. JX-17]